MITVNDYLYSGDTVLKILQRYYTDLKEDAGQTKKGVDLIHCNFLLQGLDLSKVDVNMFGAVNDQLINDGCGLYGGRLILPYEHLSRFQNDMID